MEVYVHMHMCACEEVNIWKHVCLCVCGGVCGGFFTLAGEAVNMEVCVFDTHHLPTTNLPTALTHDGRVSTTGERRAAVVVSSIKA